MENENFWLFLVIKQENGRFQNPFSFYVIQDQLLTAQQMIYYLHNFLKISSPFESFYKFSSNSDENLRENPRILIKLSKYPSNFIKNHQNCWHFLRIFWVLSGAKDCMSCRSRKTLQNEYLVAKIGVDTAENEPLKVWGWFHSLFNPLLSRTPWRRPLAAGTPRGQHRCCRVQGPPPRIHLLRHALLLGLNAMRVRASWNSMFNFEYSILS